MSDFKENNMVVQANSLIQQTSWKLNETSLKLLKVAISCIDTSNPSNTVVLGKGDVVEFLNENKSNYVHLKREFDKLITGVKLIDDNETQLTVALVRQVLWEKNKGIIQITFDDLLMPFLVNLKENFLQYEVKNLKCFDSKYGLILYEYLLSKKRCNPNINLFKLPIDNLRELTGTTKKYKRLIDFEDNVLKTALADINNNDLEITFTYEKIKIGRTIREIEFEVKMKPKNLDLKNNLDNLVVCGLHNNVRLKQSEYEYICSKFEHYINKLSVWKHKKGITKEDFDDYNEILKWANQDRVKDNQQLQQPQTAMPKYKKNNLRIEDMSKETQELYEQLIKEQKDLDLNENK